MSVLGYVLSRFCLSRMCRSRICLSRICLSRSRLCVGDVGSSKDGADSSVGDVYSGN